MKGKVVESEEKEEVKKEVEEEKVENVEEQIDELAEDVSNISIQDILDDFNITLNSYGERIKQIESHLFRMSNK